MAALVHVHGPGLPITEDVVIAVAMRKTHWRQLLSLLLDSAALNVPISDQALQTIIRRSDNAVEAMGLLLYQRNEIRLTEEMVRLAAANKRAGSQLIKVFDQHLGNRFPITEKVVKAAAGNGYQGLDILAYLLERWGHQLPITESIVIAAIQNLYCQQMIHLLQEKHCVPVTARVIEVAACSTEATSLLTMLLPQDGAESLVTPAVVSAAIQNWTHVDSLLPALIRIGEKGGRVVATQRALEEAAHVSYKATATLLPFVPHDVAISEGIMEGIAKCDQAGAAVTRMVLDRNEKGIPITAAVVRAASQNADGAEIIQLLFQRCGDSLSVTEDLVIETARGFNGELVTFLLDRGNVTTCMTSAVIEAALENRDSGIDVLNALVRLGIEIPITSKILEDVAQDPKSREDVMDLLLSQRPRGVFITEGVVKAAVSNEEVAASMLNLIVRSTAGEIPLNEEIMTAAVRNERCGEDIVSFLFDKQLVQGAPITQKVINAAARNGISGGHILARFLERKGVEYICPLFTAEVLKTAASNTHAGKEIVELMLSHEPGISIAPEAVHAAIENNYNREEIIALLLGSPGSNIPISSDLLEAAAGVSAEATKTLLGRTGNNIIITETIMRLAASNSTSGVDLVAFFLYEHGASDVIKENVLKAAAGNTGYQQGAVILTMLLNHGAKGMVTAEVVAAAAANHNQDVLNILIYRMGEQLPLSVRVFGAAMGSIHALDKLKSLLPWAESDVSLLKQVTSSATLGSWPLREKLTFVLDRWGSDFAVTEETVRSVATDGFHSEEMLSTLFEHRGHDVPVTEEVVIAAAGAGYYAKGLMTILVAERGETLPITAKILEAAVRNTSQGLDMLRLLFSDRDEDIPFSEDVLKAAAVLQDPAVMFFLENHLPVPR
ncbi:hypothetical protein BDW69DRAFT_190256 [Aspergillus filifer]